MDASDRRKRVTEEAAEWWVRLQADVSRAEREQYVDWLRESSIHVAEMLHIAEVHGALEQFRRWSGVPTDGSRADNDNIVVLQAAEQSTVGQRGVATRTRLRLRGDWVIAAMVLIATGVVAILGLIGQTHVIETDRGERREVALADGSVVQVDPETRLRVEYQARTRRILLQRGRAFFHVAKNAQRPFLVESNGTTVRAVGTAFSVEQENESTVVTVAEGQVAVITAHPPPSAGSAASDYGATVHRNTDAPSGSLDSNASGAVGATAVDADPIIYLTANQQITVARSGGAEAVHVVDSSRAIAWADGRLIFEDTTVGEAVRQFNRYNRIQIVVEDTDLARRPISGVFSAADPESFVAFMQSVARVHVTRDDTGAEITIDVAKSPLDRSN